MDPFAYILPPETAHIHCAATGLALFRRPYIRPSDFRQGKKTNQPDQKSKRWHEPTFCGQDNSSAARTKTHSHGLEFEYQGAERRPIRRSLQLHLPNLHLSYRGTGEFHPLRTLTTTGFSMQLRIGNGYDIHRLVPGRALILGGQQLEHPAGLGLDGHSDADVLVHAIMDALLGALSLGDIGKYFPPDDPQWQGADSLALLEQVVALVTERGWSVINVDSVVIAERPKLKPHIEAMRAAIAARMGLAPDQVGVKATTNEKLGPEGREEGISCQAVALLQKP